MNDITIRLAEPEDASALLSIYSYYILNTAVTSEVEVPTVEQFAARIYNITGKYPYVVAVKDGEIVGYAYAREFHDRAAYAWSCEVSIYVHRYHHREGIGRKLYTALESLLKLQNMVNLYASVSYPEEKTSFLNMDSSIFHSWLGYKNVGEFHHCRYKFHEWYNMAWMEKSISEHTKDQPDFIPFARLDKEKVREVLKKYS